jgi:drug/metabolite transporter (DMT)-like permease
MAGVRYFLAGVIMYGIAWVNGARRSTMADWRNAVIVGACLIFFGNGGVTISEKFIPSGLASLIVATVPIYMVLLGWLTGMTPRPQPIIWLGLAGGFFGVAMLLGPALVHNGLPGSPPPATAFHGNRPAIGMSILLFTSFVWSAGSLYSRRTTQVAASPFVAAAQQMLCGGVLLILMGVIVGELPRFHLSNLSTLSLWAFIYLVLIGAVVGFGAYIWLLHHCDPAKVATYAYVNPIVAVLLGAMFAGERLTLRILMAGVLIIGSVALVITIQQRRPKALPIPAVTETDGAR